MKYPGRSVEPATQVQHALAVLAVFTCKMHWRTNMQTCTVGSHVWVQATTIPDDGVFIFARDDDYFFGMLHSKIHELWARGTGTQLREVESGFRYTPTTTFETFPFPWSPGKEPGRGEAFAQDTKSIGDLTTANISINQNALTNASPLQQERAIAEAAKELVQLRDAWLNPPDASETDLKKRTLTNLYNQRPTWLDNAHKKLDAAVFAAYGWPVDLSDDEILARLLALNLERARKQHS